MLTAKKGPSCAVTEVKRCDNMLYLYSEYRTIRIIVKESGIIRITETRDKFDSLCKPGVINECVSDEWDWTENEDSIILSTAMLSAHVEKSNGCISFLDCFGNLLSSVRKPTEFQEKKNYLLSGANQKTETIDTPDGKKILIRDAEKIYTDDSYHIMWFPMFGDEALYGLGQHEEGFGSLRSHTIYVHQANRKISNPVIVSTKGYGILFDTYSPMIFNDSEEEPYIYSEAGKVWLNDASLIKFLSFEFPDDKNVWNITDQYMFGGSLMVCPVTEPMLFGPNNTVLDIKKRYEAYIFQRVVTGMTFIPEKNIVVESL